MDLSKAFWKWANPMLQEAFDDYDYSADQVHGAINSVSQSLIRVKADKLTYPLHIILHCQIQKDERLGITETLHGFETGVVERQGLELASLQN